jgi:hypothetical protein
MPFEEEWFLNLAFFEGNQWVYWNRDRLDMVNVEPHRILLVDNRLIGARADRSVEDARSSGRTSPSCRSAATRTTSTRPGSASA